MPESDFKLTVADHRRDRAGLTHVYPVVSRRAGVSIGINLNVNRACNWRCIDRQVPDLRRGSAPPVDLEVDSATPEGWPHGASTIPAKAAVAAMENLRRAAELCPVWIQTALFAPAAAAARCRGAPRVHGVPAALPRTRHRLAEGHAHTPSRALPCSRIGLLLPRAAIVFADWAAEIEALGFEAKPSA